MTRTASAAVVAVPRAVTAVALATLTILGATSCTTKPTGPAVAPSSVPPVSPSATAEEAQARDKALAAYTGYREAQIVAYAKASTDGTDIDDYVADPLLTEVELSIFKLRQQGLVGKGRPTWSPTVVKVNVATRPFTAEIEDCFDHGKWDTVRKDTGKSVVAPGQATRYLVVAKAVQYDDGRWLIQASKAHRDRPC